jgi:hypothetical protein
MSRAPWLDLTLNRMEEVPVPADPEEQRRVLGFPVGSEASGRPSWTFGPVDRAFTRALVHPLRSFRRWRRHRCLGPYDVEDDSEPG